MQESKDERSTTHNATSQEHQHRNHQLNYGSGDDENLIDDSDACQIPQHRQQQQPVVSIKQEVLDDDDEGGGGPNISYSSKLYRNSQSHSQYISRAHYHPHSSPSTFNKPLPHQPSQPPHQPTHLYTDSAAGGGSGSGGDSSWNWVHTNSSTFDPYIDYESSHSPSTSQSSPPPGPITSSYYDQLHQQHLNQPPYHRKLHPQPPLSPLSIYSYQHVTPYSGHYPAQPTSSPTNLSVPTYYMNQQQRRTSTSSEFSDMKSPINYEVLPPITHNINYSNPDPAYSEAGTSKLHAQQPPAPAIPTISAPPPPRPPPPPITRLHRKSSAVGKELKTKSSSTSLRNRAKTSPSYLLDKRPPDSTGFVNYDARDGHVIMSAVAPSGNCKKYKNRISKKPSNAKLRNPSSSSKRQE